MSAPLSMGSAFQQFIYTYKAQMPTGLRVVFVWCGRSRDDADEAFAETVGRWPDRDVDVEVARV